MGKCKHPIVQFRYSVEFKESRDYSFAVCSYCAARGEAFSIKIDTGELAIKTERAKDNFLHHAKNNSEMPEKTNKLEFGSCPFCGSDQTAMIRESVATGVGTIYHVSCATCDARGPHSSDELKAFDRWNERSV